MRIRHSRTQLTPDTERVSGAVEFYILHARVLAYPAVRVSVPCHAGARTARPVPQL